MEATGQFESIVNDSGLARLERLTTEEITGTESELGIIERYLTLSADGNCMLQDMQLNPDGMRIGDKRLCLHTLSDLDDPPGRVKTDGRYERLSTDRSDCRLSYAAPVGVMLPCDHIYNQWIFIDDSGENLSRFEKMAKNMQSLSRYSRSNQINKQWLDEYLNEAHTNGLQSVRCHCNIIAWAENGDELRRVKNDVGSALALMECTPHHNTTDLPALYWAGIPGNEADFPSEETFYTFTGQALCFFTAETCYRNSLSPFGIRMVDRLTAVAARKETVSLEDIQYTKFGRPYFNTLRNFDFNISHSENMVACAITNEGRIGIDIEKRKSIDIIDFEDQFSDAEWIHIKNEKFPYYTFYDCWTKKEAILKADGRGMTLSLHLIDTIGSKKITIDNNSWFILEIDTFKNYTCSIACSVLRNNIDLHSVDFKANPINEILTYYKISSRL